MMNRNSYRTGAAARLLGITPYELRRLHEAGLVNAEVTPTGQARYSEAEVQRLLKEGVPPLPAPVVNPERLAATPPVSTGAHRSPRPDGLRINKVVESAEDVEVTKNLLRRRQIELDLAAVEVQARELQEREEERRVQREERERERREEEERQKAWEEWERLPDIALKKLGNRVPLAVRNRLEEALRDFFARHSPDMDPEAATAHLEVQFREALAPWLREQEVEQIIWEEAEDLPADMRLHETWPQWRLRAVQRAKAAVMQLPGNSPLREVLLVVHLAVDDVRKEFQHERLCQKLARVVYVVEASYDERGEGSELILKALKDLPVGATERQMKQAAEEALEPIRKRVRQREDRGLKNAVARNAPVSWNLPRQVSEEAREAARAAVAQAPFGLSRGELERVRDKAYRACVAALTEGQEEPR